MWVWGGERGALQHLLECWNPGRPPLPHGLDHVFFASPQAMDGSMSIEVALDERLKIINCKPKWVAGCTQGAGSSSGPCQFGLGSDGMAITTWPVLEQRSALPSWSSYRRDIKEFLMANPPETRLAKVNGLPAGHFLLLLRQQLPPP